ncbi:MAG: universal stress protein [Gemmatimonadetes bacterium]|nr:universal stress protein [Gemmatimonadota bacterium]
MLPGMNRVVVPLDGSGFARRALPVATALADRAGAWLTLVSVYRSRYDQRFFSEDPHAESEREAQLAWLEQEAQSLGMVGGRPVQFELLEGQPAPTLAGWLRRARPDLVVMTTHGRGPWSRFWLGSVADGLLKDTTVPTLLLRPEVTSEPASWRRILVTLDLSAGSDSVLAAVTPIARLLDAEITLLHVVVQAPFVSMGLGAEGAVTLPTDYTQRLRAEAESRLSGLVETLRSEGMRSSFRVHHGSNPAEAILTELATGNYDLAALATRAPEGVARVVLGSVADKIIRAAEVPVLVTHVVP